MKSNALRSLLFFKFQQSYPVSYGSPNASIITLTSKGVKERQLG